MRMCPECKNTMHKASNFTSGNARFETWQCDHCDHSEEICAGFS